MRPMFLGLVVAIALAGCAGPSPSSSATASMSALAPASASRLPTPFPSKPSTGAIGTAEEAAVVAKQMTTIGGPWTIGDVDRASDIAEKLAVIRISRDAPVEDPPILTVMTAQSVSSSR